MHIKYSERFLKMDKIAKIDELNKTDMETSINTTLVSKQMYYNLHQLMETKGINAKQLAEEVGLASSTITEWKKGRARPSWRTIQKLSAFFGVPALYFINGLANSINTSLEPFKAYEELQKGESDGGRELQKTLIRLMKEMQESERLPIEGESSEFFGSTDGENIKTSGKEENNNNSKNETPLSITDDERELLNIRARLSMRDKHVLTTTALVLDGQLDKSTLATFF